jgi:mono/diheme cytochrome c family protein
MYQMKKSVFAILAVVILFSSCNRDRSKPNMQYMPDMYVSVPYEPYGINPKMPDSLASLVPPTGAIARGKMPFEYAAGTDGYNAALANLKSPLPVTEENLANGKKMFDIYCATCHGVKGDGQGKLVQNGKFLGVPNYKDRAITEGSIYHVIYYGRNMMGAHATLLTEKERWQVVQYVQKLRTDLMPVAEVSTK